MPWDDQGVFITLAINVAGAAVILHGGAEGASAGAGVDPCGGAGEGPGVYMLTFGGHFVVC